jgi:hypothetical protein
VSSTSTRGRQEGAAHELTPGPSEDDSSEDLSDDELFEVLANRRRRYAVHALKQEGGTAELGDVAEQVAAWEYDVEVDQVSYEERKRVYTALQQSHLPMMDDANIVKFDKNRGLVTPTTTVDDIDVYMEVVQGNEIPWSVYYLGLSGVAVSLVLALAVNAWPFVLLPNVAWVAAITAMFAVSAVVHTYYARGQRIGREDIPPELRQE